MIPSDSAASPIIPKFARLRFRLRTFLILFLPAFAVVITLVNRELAIIEAMDALGRKGIINLQPAGPACVRWLAHKRWPMWLRKIGWRYGYKVESVSLFSTTDDDIQHICNINDIESVSLPGTAYRIETLHLLRRMPKLREVTLGDRFSHAELEHIRKILPENCKVGTVRERTSIYDPMAPPGRSP